MAATPPPESPNLALSELQAIVEELAQCVDRLDAAGFAIEAHHVDHGRALIASRLRRGLAEDEALRLRAAALALIGRR